MARKDKVHMILNKDSLRLTSVLRREVYRQFTERLYSECFNTAIPFERPMYDTGDLETSLMEAIEHHHAENS
jgi:hypothetical protein